MHGSNGGGCCLSFVGLFVVVVFFFVYSFVCVDVCVFV